MSALGVLLVSCSAPADFPEPLKKPFDSISLAVTGEDPYSRCYKSTTDRGITVFVFIGSRKCYSFGPQQRFSGIYFDEFEGQIFLPGAVPSSRYLAPAETLWLDFDELSERKILPPDNESTSVWLIDFIGRKTSSGGGFGHMGMSDGEILVDKVLSAKLVQSGQGYLSETLIVRRAKQN